MTEEELNLLQAKAKKMGYQSNLESYALKMLTSKHHLFSPVYDEKQILNRSFSWKVPKHYALQLQKRAIRLKMENDFQFFLRKAFFTKYFVADKPKKSDKEKRIGVRLSEDERSYFEQKSKNLGMSMSDYFRQLIFKKDVVITNPDKLIDELYLARAEVNKIGSNINQIANYANFLSNQNYLEKEAFENFRTEALAVKTALYNLKNTIDQTIKKV